MKEHFVASILSCIDGLKNMVRSGWMMRGIPASIGESVAEHSFEASFIGLLLAHYAKGRGINVSPEKVAAMAVVHDFAECVIGDIPSKVAPELGNKKEELEFLKIRELLGDAPIIDLFQEYYQQKTLESAFARLAEKLATYAESRRMLSLGFSRVNEILQSIDNEIKAIVENLGDEVKAAVRDFTNIFLSSTAFGKEP